MLTVTDVKQLKKTVETLTGEEVETVTYSFKDETYTLNTGKTEITVHKSLWRHMKYFNPVSFTQLVDLRLRESKRSLVCR